MSALSINSGTPCMCIHFTKTEMPLKLTFKQTNTIHLYVATLTLSNVKHGLLLTKCQEMHCCTLFI